MQLNNWIAQNFAIVFPPYFALLWLTITTLLAVLSGWFRLMAKFPNQPEEPLLQLRMQSGSMGLGVHMRGVLNLAACSSGLRVGIMRIFGPFCRDFFVPWKQITVTRKTILFSPLAKIEFGDPMIGSLTIPAHVADRLARASAGRWPERGLFPEETHRNIFRRLFVQWALITVIASLFFTLVPLAAMPPGSRPPIAVTILFPAVAFGIFTAARYFSERT